MIKKIVKKFLSLKERIKISNHKVNKMVDFDIVDAEYNIEKIYTKKEYGNFRLNNISSEEYENDLSLIVPVYNANKYIEECVDSLVNQKTEYQYELILIDDGSTDNSYEILLNLQKKYANSNISVVHQENRGISATRNKGLQLSKGKYVGFIDNDDYVSNNYVQLLLDSAFKYNADYVKCGFEVMDEKTKKCIYKTNYRFEIINEKSSIQFKKYDGYVWSGIQKRELWNNFSFPEGYWYEDMIVKMYLYQKAINFVNIEDLIYIKRSHGNNASLSVWNSKNSKCIDQLFLPMLIEEIKKENGVCDSVFGYYTILQELGPMLYRRTKGLTELEVKSAFVIASNYINSKSKKYYYEKENFVEKNARIALEKNDFVLWKQIGKYARYE